jgi:thiosulfate sulfurtransferase
MMSDFKHIDLARAQQMIASQAAVVVDIRDANSFTAAHIEGSIHLTNDTLSRFLADADFEQPLIVVCYHGISSQGAAQYLVQQGFDDVYSMDGGFEGWRRQYPFLSAE